MKYLLYSLFGLVLGLVSLGFLVPLIIDAALEYATLGEIVQAIEKVYGKWEETAFF